MPPPFLTMAAAVAIVRFTCPSAHSISVEAAPSRYVSFPATTVAFIFRSIIAVMRSEPAHTAGCCRHDPPWPQTPIAPQGAESRVMRCPQDIEPTQMIVTRSDVA